MSRTLQTLSLIAIAAADTVFVGAYKEQFQTTQASLSPVNEMILASPGFIWLLPLAALLAQVADRMKLRTEPLRLGWISSIAFTLGMAWVPIALYGSYLSFVGLSVDVASMAR